MSININHQLFEPFTLGGLRLSNRIIMAPMTRSRAIETKPGELEAIYYSQRASAGLIITEGTAPCPNGLGYARTPGIFSADHVKAWKKVTDSVHQQGGKIFVQLMHVGRIAHPNNMISGAKILAPSAIAATTQMWTDQAGLQPMPLPKSMTIEEIRQTIQEFADAAVLAMEAGFDGIELHGANGYLIEQFINPNTNQRTDEYGGNIANRARFLLELVKEVSKQIGNTKTGVRLSPYSTYNDMASYPETAAQYEYLARELNKLSPVYLHIVEPAARALEEGVKLLKTMRRSFAGSIIFNGGYDLDNAIKKLESKEADLISFGSLFISNPDLPGRFLKKAPLTAPDSALFFTPGEKGYIDYPVS